MKAGGFQMVILGLFGFFLLAGAISFATFRSSGGEDIQIDPVSMWGTLPEAQVTQLVGRMKNDLGITIPLTYTEFSEESFDQELIEALAAGEGPDMMIISQDRIMRHRDKLVPIPFESFPERAFKDRYVEEGELFLTQDGILAFPFILDPMVLYWNRTLFSNAGIARPPFFWDELFTLTNQLTRTDDRGTILESTIALGEYTNVRHAKEIVATLVLQAGNGIVGQTNQGIRSILSNRISGAEVPAEAALRFYTEFANPIKPVYSWNRSLPDSQDMFLAGDLAMYVGFASELFVLQEKNPNLNFDVTSLPQIQGREAQKTFGHMGGIGILKNSPRIASAFQAMTLLLDTPAVEVWQDITQLPPPRRDILAEQPGDAYMSVFYKEALIADAFLDPDKTQTNTIFRGMIEDVTSGVRDISEAVTDAHAKIDQLLGV